MTDNLESQIRSYADYLDEVDPVDAPPSYTRLANSSGSSRAGRGWFVAAAAVVVVLGGLGVGVSAMNDNREGAAVGTTSESTALPEEVVDGEPTLARPVSGPVEFTITTPDGELQGSMQRTAGSDGTGSGFCAEVSIAGGCYGSTHGTYEERPHLMGLGMDPDSTVAAVWLVPDRVQELLVTWDDGSSIVLPIARPIEGLPGVTGALVPDGVYGGTATAGGVSSAFELEALALRDR